MRIGINIKVNKKKRKQMKKTYDLQNRRRRKLGKYEAVFFFKFMIPCIISLY